MICPILIAFFHVLIKLQLVNVCESNYARLSLISYKAKVMPSVNIFLLVLRMTEISHLFEFINELRMFQACFRLKPQWNIVSI